MLPKINICRSILQNSKDPVREPGYEHGKGGFDD